MRKHPTSIVLLCAAFLLLLTPLIAQDEEPADHSAAHLLNVPPGFEVTVYAEGQNFGLPTQMDFGPDGNLYVLSLAGGVYRLIDDDRLLGWRSELHHRREC
jgi:hypothetical protein